ncbi:MAG TPA: C40 family peptidase [Chitinophagaceae bacterium]|jgi:cell wall-associated NlpC family hydrolase|nr:C40 family peptidase [Chitinophagaceae bacterium]
MSGYMALIRFYCGLLVGLFITSCNEHQETSFKEPPSMSDSGDSIADIDSTITPQASPFIIKTGKEINTGTTEPASIVAFAKSLIGAPYLYASCDPANGFDCSGFITYVFNHFGIAVPRSSVDFTNMGKEISKEVASPGDLILFTGTDTTISRIGHMGIVERVEEGNLFFIHSTSGKAMSVVVSPLKGYYEKRFVKMIRVFPDVYFK